MKRRKVFWVATAVLGGVVAFWLFGLKLILKLHKGRGAPCPSSWSWIVDNPLRRWDVRHADRRSEEYEQLPGGRTGTGLRSAAPV